MAFKPQRVSSSVYYVCICCGDRQGVHHYLPQDERCCGCGREGTFIKTSKPQLPELTPALTRIRDRALLVAASVIGSHVENRDEDQDNEEKGDEIMAKKKTVKKATKVANGQNKSGGGLNPETGVLQFTTGKTLGLGIQQTWVHLFEQNERAKRSEKQNDVEICRFMLKEFPTQDSKLFNQLRDGVLHRVQAMRARYNRGGMTNGKVPGMQSHRYDSEGNYDDTPYSGKAGVTMKDVIADGAKLSSDHLANLKDGKSKKPAPKAAKKGKKSIRVKRPRKTAAATEEKGEASS